MELHSLVVCLDSHAGISKSDIRFMSNQLDVLLRPTLPSCATKDKHSQRSATVGGFAVYGTGEEQMASIIASCDALSKLIRSAVASTSDLPLSVTAVLGISPAFRYSEVTAMLVEIFSLLVRVHVSRAPSMERELIERRAGRAPRLFAL